MRIYDGSPRQDFEEVLRSIGAFLDQRGMRDVLLLEVPDGFIVQGLVMEGDKSSWSDALGHQVKETLTFLDEDIARFMEEAMARRGAEAGEPPDWSKAGYYEKSFRVLGRWMDSQRPHDIFFFEQGGAFVVRIRMVDLAGSHHTLAEFTKDDIEALITEGPEFRQRTLEQGGRP